VQGLPPPGKPKMTCMLFPQKTTMRLSGRPAVKLTLPWEMEGAVGMEVMEDMVELVAMVATAVEEAMADSMEEMLETEAMVEMEERGEMVAMVVTVVMPPAVFLLSTMWWKT